MTSSRVRLCALLFALIWFLGACESLLPCKEFNRLAYYPKEARLIVRDKGPVGREFHLKGQDPVTQKAVDYDDDGGYFIAIRAAIDLGDTLIKVKEQSAYLIKKRGYNVLVNCPCQEISPTNPQGYGPTEMKKLTKSLVTIGYY